jgi:hypothetical protein
MVAQVDEKDAAMVPHTMDPAGQADRLVDVAGAKCAAGMGPVAMHVDPEDLENARESAERFGRGSV